MKSKNKTFVVKLEDDQVTFSLRKETFYATSFYQNRINEFYDEIKDTPEEEAIEIIKQWNESKMINFWPKLEIK